MKIFLKEKTNKWKLHNINNIYDSNELKKRKIIIYYPCEIGKNVKIEDNVIIGSDTQIFDDVEIQEYSDIDNFVIIKNNCVIHKNVKISHYSCILNNTVILDNAKIEYNVTIGESSLIGENVLISENIILQPEIIVRKRTNIYRTPIFINGTKHNIYDIGKGFLKIGCEIHSINKWLKKEFTEKMARKHFYNNEELKEYRKHIKHISKIML